MQTLVLSKSPSESALKADVEEIARLLIGEELFVLAPFLVKGDRVSSVVIESYNKENVLDAIKSKKIKSLKRVVLSGFEREEVLPIELVAEFLSYGVDAINGLYDSGIGRYAPFKNAEATSLLVFPGALLPLNMGSHQRAFLLLAALNYSGYFTDVIITGGNQKALDRAKRLLLSIAPRIFTYKNNKRKLPDHLWLRRESERLLRKHFLKKSDVPELFADRYSNKATESLKKTLAKLQEENEYKNIIVSYAWMSRCLEYISEEKLQGVNLICDTHDVQYMRNASSNKLEKRYFAFSGSDAWLEKRVLAKYDHVLAISKSDVDELKKVKAIKNKSLLVTSAFDYALKKPRRIGHKAVLNFGFIGGGMDANVKALLFILKSWWPKMASYSPGSQFFIAGSVCKKDAVIEASFFDESVVKLGFVDNIAEFYDRIDVALNPVLVQGGLNFKSVEAVMAGKLLITNELGSKCLGDSDIASVADSAEQFLHVLKEFEFLGLSASYDLLHTRQQKALSEFGEQTAYRQLKRVLAV